MFGIDIEFAMCINVSLKLMDKYQFLWAKRESNYKEAHDL